MLSPEARRHLEQLCDEFIRGASACHDSGAMVATLLFILTATEHLSLYYAGSRRTAGAKSSRAFHQFLARYFVRFNRDARNARGRVHHVRIPLLREGGKAHKRLKLHSALIHLYRRGVILELIAPAGSGTACVVIPGGPWGFQIRVDAFLHDFKEGIERYAMDVREEPRIAARFARRYHHVANVARR